MKKNQQIKFEVRRIQGMKLLKKGVPQAEISRILGVSRQAVNAWTKRLEVTVYTGFGSEISSTFAREIDVVFDKEKSRKFRIESKSLRSSRLGRPSVLDGNGFRKLKNIIERGAKNYGSTTDKWSVRKLTDVVNDVLLEGSESLSTTQVLRILRNLGYGCEKPSSENQALLRKWERLGWVKY